VLAHVHAYHHAVIHQPRQAVAENVFGDAQAVLEIHKAAGAQHGLLDHQQGPPVTDLIEGAGYRAAHVVEAFTCHGGSIDQNGCIKKPNKVLLRNQIELIAREGGCADSVGY